MALGALETLEGRATPVAAALRRAAEAVAAPAVCFLAARLVVALTLALVDRGRDPVTAIHPLPWPVAPGSGRLVDLLGTWDAGWYVHLAAHGYTTSLDPPNGFSAGMAFFPLLPLLIRMVSHLGPSPLAAGAILVAAVGLADAVLLRRLCLELTGDRGWADRAVLLWCLWPGAYVLSLVYAEGLTVLLALVCLLSLARRRWLAAGVAAALATATQPDALALVAGCAWAAASAVRRGDRRSLIAPVLAPAGFLAYMGWLWSATGHPDAWYVVEGHFWKGGLDIHGATVGLVSRFLAAPSAPDNWVPLAGVAFVVVAGLALRRMRPPAPVVLFAAGVVVSAMASGPVGLRPRFLLVAFPLVIAVAGWARGWRLPVVAVASVVLLGWLTALTSAGLVLTP
ncbi:MAG TPA: mannosyltransferase family protein [Acidimicrobiales bacterium]|nr:mannosyltransferase family protein [Acidimicrobiales bacterium]